MELRQKYWNRILVAGCGLMFGGITAVSLCLPQKGFSESENRYLQKRPDFSWSTLTDGSFGTAYEAYLSDQFPGRDGWVGMKTVAERMVGKTDANGVYFGKEGYLIEKFETEDLEGTVLRDNISTMGKALKRMERDYGIDHVRGMLVPGASEILTQKLPPLASPYRQGQIVEELQKEWDCLNLMVQVDSVLKEKSEEELYYKTDHHWTTLGAYYGYVAWMESLGETPWVLDQFVPEVVSRNFLGTLYSKVQGRVAPDQITLYQPKTPVEYHVEYDGNGVWTEGLYRKSALADRDQYSVFLDGNHGLVRIQNQGTERQEERYGKKLLIIKDSYAHSFAPFAANHFEETLLVDLRYFNADIETFAKEEQVTDILILYRIPGFATDRTVSKLR